MDSILNMPIWDPLRHPYSGATSVIGEDMEDICLARIDDKEALAVVVVAKLLGEQTKRIGRRAP